MHTKIPLGYIELDNGSKAIYTMNDFFLNFTFEKEEYWETLRLMINILIAAYRSVKPDTVINLIEGDIQVETQYKFYLNTKNTTRNQDIKVTELMQNEQSEQKKLTYVEFQNRANTVPPIKNRAIEYFSLGINQGGGKTANQIWLLAEDVDSLLHGEMFTNYILTDEMTGELYPDTSGMMFISLAKLSQENSAAGELASFMLGKDSRLESEEAKSIANAINASFEAFKADKEVKNTMSVAEKYRNEGWVEGVEVGEAKGIAIGEAKGEARGITIGEARGEARGEAKGINLAVNKALELIKNGINPTEALLKIQNEHNTQN